MDMIILAGIAAFIAYRLYATLGEKTGFQGENQQQNNVVDFTKRPLKPPVAQRASIDDIPKEFQKDIQSITKKDPEFSLSTFKENATIAFEIILKAYADGDLKTLKNLLSSDIYTAFKEALKDLSDKGHTLENTLVRVESVDLLDVIVSGVLAQIKLKFTTEQMPIIKNKEGDIIDGNPNQIDQVIDTWTFERKISAKDPRWVLVSTED